MNAMLSTDKRDGDQLVGREQQIHRLRRDHVAEEDQRRRDEQRDLRRGSDGDGDGGVHLVLCRQHHRREVLGGIADQRDDDDADEQVGHAEIASGRATTDVTSSSLTTATAGRRGEEHDHRPPDFRLSVRAVARRGAMADRPKETAMRAQREDHADAIREKKHNRDGRVELQLAGRRTPPPARTWNTAGTTRPITLSINIVVPVLAAVRLKG